MAKDYSSYSNQICSIGKLTNDSKVLSSSIISDIINDCFVVSSLNDIISSSLAPGDIAIVSSEIGEHTGKYSRTAYFWNKTSTRWEALDGNYDAENVYFNNDISCVGAWISVGNINKGSTTGITSIPAKGHNIKEVFDSIFFKDQDDAIIEQPSLVASVTNSTNEVGTTVFPTYKLTFSPGSYTYGSLASDGTWINGTGVAFDVLSATLVGEGGQTISTLTSIESGSTLTSQTSVIFADNAGETFKINGFVSWLSGNTVCTAAHKTSTKNPISSGSIIRSANLVAGYRKPFWGHGNDELLSSSIDSSFIRNTLSANSGTYAKNLPTQYIVDTGAKWIVFACDQLNGYNNIVAIDDNSKQTQTFEKINVNVEGANSYVARPYNVFYKTFSTPTQAEMNLKITWS